MPIKFKQVSPEELDNTRDASRGRVSYPIIKGFMETGFYIAEVDLTEHNKKAQHMQMLLKSFVDNNSVPVKVLMRRGRLYLMRLDIDEQGNAIPNWKEIRDREKLAAHGLIPDSIETEVVPLTDDVVAKKTGRPIDIVKKVEEEE